MADENEPSWGHYLGLGLQVAVGAVLGLVIGQWLDHRYGWGDKATLIGVGLGIAAGMYLLIREGIRANK